MYSCLLGSGVQYVIHIQENIMHHYAYLLEFKNGMKYVGARSGKVEPRLDSTYLGSGRYLPASRHENRQEVTKTILAIFNTREELIEFEENYIVNNNCVDDPNYYNKRIRVYDKHGKNHKPRGFTEQDRLKASNTIRKRNYTKGANRTPAQLAHDQWCIDNFVGVKNPAKGHKGITNHAFIPWYYIDPQGNYVEVHDKTKIEKAPELGFTPRQLGHAFHYTNEHVKSNRLPRKGWTFGNLPRPI